ncbi:MAG: type II toxin-antitoxin system RelE/ParE family toxin [Defluviitaleaceae bacterium]|nr:type II toxin-antitoxin system RelE/ParE family toxin [Defluviitaleaceae bacterium]
MRTQEQKLPPEYSKKAVKYLSGLDSITKQRLKIGIEKIPQGDIRPLEGSKKSLRLRIGDFRVIFSWISNEQIFIEKISPRGSIYKGA